MFTQKLLQELLLHHSLEQQDCTSAILICWLNEMSERIQNIEALLEKRQRTELHQVKEVKRAMLEKVENQLNHIERTHVNTISELTEELKGIKKVLESTKSKFMGFQ
jgi:esterase/lipase